MKDKGPVADVLPEDRWDYAVTELARVERVKGALGAFDLSPSVDVPFILSVLDRAGLFHPPVPAPMITSKTIRRAAHAAVRRLQCRIERIQAGREIAATDRERELAEDWPRLGPAALQMERDKIECATYQLSRGGRIVPIGPHAGRRPERELTYALLMVDCHVGQAKPNWSYAEGIRCLTAIVRAVDDRQDDALMVEARIRQRLREAQNDESLRIGKQEYLDALSLIVVTKDMQGLMQRKHQFVEMMATFCSAEVPESIKEQVAVRLGPTFRPSFS